MRAEVASTAAQQPVAARAGSAPGPAAATIGTPGPAAATDREQAANSVPGDGGIVGGAQQAAWTGEALPEVLRSVSDAGPASGTGSGGRVPEYWQVCCWCSRKTECM